MASKQDLQQDLQDLLRILTRRNVSVMTAMSQVKSLQGAKLRSIPQIADAPLDVIAGALGGEKAARTVQASCRNHIREGFGPKAFLKRPWNSSDAPGLEKRARLDAGDSVPAATHSKVTLGLEDALAMTATSDEQLIASTRVYTNRAPLLLAFAFEVLHFTMPEQPISSRLSLAQAVVSTNARSKAASMGLLGAGPPPPASWGEGQPKVVVMGREISVLRRDGYDPSEEVPGGSGEGDQVPISSDGFVEKKVHPKKPTEVDASFSWSASRPATLRGSTFVARIITLSNAAEGPKLVRALVDADPNLKTATHNSWGLRVRCQGVEPRDFAVVENSDDDGEAGCGAFILGLLNDAQMDDTLVVITRWFGGVMLGPDRWRLIKNCFEEAVSERLRRTGETGRDGRVALWALDVAGMDGRDNRSGALGKAPHCDWNHHSVPGALVFRPEPARDYLRRSFLSRPPDTQQPRGATGKSLGPELPGVTEQNLACVLGAIRALLVSWEGHLSTQEIDSKAWDWYATVRPQVEQGPSGWGAKGWLELKDVLALRHGESSASA